MTRCVFCQRLVDIVWEWVTAKDGRLFYLRLVAPHKNRVRKHCAGAGRVAWEVEK